MAGREAGPVADIRRRCWRHEPVADGGRWGILLISQFTLHASTRKGTRPSWHRAAKPEVAVTLYEAFHRRLQELANKPVPTGVFGAEMKVALVNDGPVTLIVDSK